jgi:hypothetical protein
VVDARPSWRFALLAGASLASTALVRVWIVPWVAPLLLMLALAALLRRRLGQRKSRSLARSGRCWRLALTLQSGVHLAMWVVPLVREAADGTPRSKTVA